MLRTSCQKWRARCKAGERFLSSGMRFEHAAAVSRSAYGQHAFTETTRLVTVLLLPIALLNIESFKEVKSIDSLKKLVNGFSS